MSAVVEDGWLGLWNARDLAGVPAADGRSVRAGALVRSEAPTRLDGPGWEQVVAHGVRTVVDLRTAWEVARDPSSLPGVAVDVVHTALEEGLEDDEQFASWASSGLISTPLYYGPFLQRWPDRCVEALRSVAHARPGGVLVHCAKGRDRTGLVVALVLLVCGVSTEDVLADYAETARRATGPAAVAAGVVDERDQTQRVLAGTGFADAPATLRHLLETADPLGRLRAAGLSSVDEAALRSRLLTTA